VAELGRRIFRRVGRLLPKHRVRSVDFGTLDRLTPIDRDFGFDRGQPIDRHYIETFLGKRGAPPADIRGRVLEVGGSEYADRFGDSIERVDVLDVDLDNPQATIVSDLSEGEGIPSEAFECVICTQTLLLIYDVGAAVRTIHRALAPGGVALVTVPGISQVCRPRGGSWIDYWRFTSASAERLFADVFGTAQVSIEAFGNVLTSAAFLYGLAVEDLDPSALETHDPDYELLIAIRAVKR
jgi:SAM-dependent methyltransferase